MATCRLRELPVGGMARISGIDDTHRSYRTKLLSMGLTRGTALFVRNIAPLGDPILVTVRGFDLSLRRDEADALLLERLFDDPETHGFQVRHRHGRFGWGRGRHRNGRRHHRHGRGATAVGCESCG